MNNKPEKAVRPRWQIVILMVAASIAWGLILYCLDWTMHWDLEPLEYFIVTVVALFIYLILFFFSKGFRKSLTQENICSEPKKLF